MLVNNLWPYACVGLQYTAVMSKQCMKRNEYFYSTMHLTDQKRPQTLRRWDKISISNKCWTFELAFLQKSTLLGSMTILTLIIIKAVSWALKRYDFWRIMWHLKLWNKWQFKRSWYFCLNGKSPLEFIWIAFYFSSTSLNSNYNSAPC